MQILLMHRTEKKWEDGVRPSPELAAGMGQLIGQMIESGVFLDAAGLRASSLGARVTFAGGKRTVTPGPFVGGNELPAAFTLVRVRSLEEAIGWATRHARVLGDLEMDVRPVTEPWDIGFGEKPAGLDTTRYMLLRKADRASESGVAPSRETGNEMASLIDEMLDESVFLASVDLAPSAHAKRMRFTRGKSTVTDGPFAESKELIAGYCLVRVDTIEDAIRWATKFADVVGDVELDVRPARQIINHARSAWQT